MPALGPRFKTILLGGDLAQNLPRPQVTGLQGRPVSNAAPETAQYLGWTGSVWGPTTLPPPPTPSPRVLTLEAALSTTQTDNLAPKIGGVSRWKPADYTGATSVIWHAAVSTTNALDPVTVELYQYAGIGSPQLLASTGSNLSSMDDVSVDVTTFFTSSPPDGIYGVQFYLAVNNGIDTASLFGSWLEIVF